MDLRHFVWLLVLGIPGLSTKKNLLASKRFCGFQHSDDFNRKVNNTAITEFPWLARLGYHHANYPGRLAVSAIGSLISDRYILTAAACCTYDELILKKVILGEFNFFKTEDCVMETHIQECSDPVQFHNVDKVLIHPNYTGNLYENNIALVRLEKTVKYSEYIRPICLPSADSNAIQIGDVVTACGWHIKVQKGDVKMCSEGEVISYGECDSEYRKHFAIELNENIVCTSRVNNTIDIACSGDLGSPAALTRRRKQWYQEGIIIPIQTLRCQDSNVPVLFLKVSNYYDWIVDSLEIYQ